jgi:hypothetical protein
MFADMNEIQEVMSRSYAMPDGLDDADLEAGTFFLIYIYYYPNYIVCPL